MEAELSLLSHMVLDQNKLVTCSQLLKNTDLTVKEAQKYFLDFKIGSIDFTFSKIKIFNFNQFYFIITILIFYLLFLFVC